MAIEVFDEGAGLSLYAQTLSGSIPALLAMFKLQTRDEIILGILMGPVGPMGFPWEWESLG